MKVFKIVTNCASEWNGNQFAHHGTVYYKKGNATTVLQKQKCAFYANRFEKVWVQEYNLKPVINSPHQQCLVDMEEFK